MSVTLIDLDPESIRLWVDSPERGSMTGVLPGLYGIGLDVDGETELFWYGVDRRIDVTACDASGAVVFEAEWTHPDVLARLFVWRRAVEARHGRESLDFKVAHLAYELAVSDMQTGTSLSWDAAGSLVDHVLTQMLAESLPGVVTASSEWAPF